MCFRVGNSRTEENLPSSSLLNNALSIISTKRFNDLLNSVTERSPCRGVSTVTVSRIENFKVYGEIKKNIEKNTRIFWLIISKIVRSRFSFFLLYQYFGYIPPDNLISIIHDGYQFQTLKKETFFFGRIWKIKKNRSNDSLAPLNSDIFEMEIFFQFSKRGRFFIGQDPPTR